MKLQALFSLKNKSKKIKVSSAAIFVWRFKAYRSNSTASCELREFKIALYQLTEILFHSKID